MFPEHPYTCTDLPSSWMICLDWKFHIEEAYYMTHLVEPCWAYPGNSFLFTHDWQGYSIDHLMNNWIIVTYQLWIFCYIFLCTCLFMDIYLGSFCLVEYMCKFFSFISFIIVDIGAHIEEFHMPAETYLVTKTPPSVAPRIIVQACVHILRSE